MAFQLGKAKPSQQSRRVLSLAKCKTYKRKRARDRERERGPELCSQGVWEGAEPPRKVTYVTLRSLSHSHSLILCFSAYHNVAFKTLANNNNNKNRKDNNNNRRGDNSSTYNGEGPHPMAQFLYELRLGCSQAGSRWKITSAAG